MTSAFLELTGLIVALITPLSDDGMRIDEASLKEQVDRLIDAGVHGLAPGGSTGECMALDLEERKALTELTIKFAAGRVPVVPGVGTVSTKDAVDLATHASKAGAAAVLIVPPFYEPVTLEQLHAHLSTVSKASGLPLVYYNVPGVTGLPLSPSELDNLSKYGVKYVKNTSNNGPDLTDLLFSRKNIITFNGWDTLTFYSIVAGSKGAIWGAPNIIPELCVALWNAINVKKDLELARELWVKILPVCQFLESSNYTCAVKTAVQLQGYRTGPLRAPLSHLGGVEKKELITVLNAAGINIHE